MTRENCYFEGVFITHSHYDHMEGAMEIIELMKSLGKPIPKIFKFVDGGVTEQNRLRKSPELAYHLYHVAEGDVGAAEPEHHRDHGEADPERDGLALLESERLLFVLVLLDVDAKDTDLVGERIDGLVD